MEQLLEVARIALGAVIDKDFVKTQSDTTGGKIVLQNSFAQEVVALLGTVTTETVGSSHLVDGLVHSLNDSRTEWLGDITNTQRDDIGLGVHHLEGIDLLGNIGEQVVVLEIQKVDIY